MGGHPKRITTKAHIDFFSPKLFSDLGSGSVGKSDSHKVGRTESGIGDVETEQFGPLRYLVSPLGERRFDSGDAPIGKSG